MTYCKIDVNNCSSSLLLSALAHFCSQLVLIFALGSCSFLFSARAQFCSRLVLIFVLGSCSILLSARAHFCSRLVLIFVLGSCSLLLGNHRSYPFSLSNRCSYARPTGPPYRGGVSGGGSSINGDGGDVYKQMVHPALAHKSLYNDPDYVYMHSVVSRIPDIQSPAPNYSNYDFVPTASSLSTISEVDKPTPYENHPLNMHGILYCQCHNICQ